MEKKNPQNPQGFPQKIPVSQSDKSWLWIILGLVIIGGIYLYQHRDSLNPDDGKQVEKVDSTEDEESGWVPPAEGESKSPLSESEDAPPSGEIDRNANLENEAPVDKNDPRVQAFNYALTEMQKCFEIPSGQFAGKTWAPSEDSIADILKAPMGDYSHQATHWESTEIKTADGQLRRIKVEEVIDEEGRREKRLTYFNINDRGEAEPIQIPKDPQILETLSREGEVVERGSEKSMVFSNGEEVLLNLKNEKINSIEVNHLGIEFSCRDLQLAGPSGSGNYSCFCQNPNSR